jgi:arylsulfatase
MHWTHDRWTTQTRRNRTRTNAPVAPQRPAIQHLEAEANMKKGLLRLLSVVVVAGLASIGSVAQAQARKPNILVIWGDDIGGFNISAYNQGVMGYRTPNIDSIARDGVMFTDWYGQQSCTAGRAAFVTGQSPIRTGLTKVGLPGAPRA